MSVLVLCLEASSRQREPLQALQATISYPASKLINNQAGELHARKCQIFLRMLHLFDRISGGIDNNQRLIAHGAEHMGITRFPGLTAHCNTSRISGMLKRSPGFSSGSPAGIIYRLGTAVGFTNLSTISASARSTAPGFAPAIVTLALRASSSNIARPASFATSICSWSVGQDRFASTSKTRRWLCARRAPR